MNRKFEDEVTDVAHKNWWQTFETIFGIPFLAAIALQFAMPLSLPRGSLTFVVIFGGVTLIIAGVVLIILARREFAQYDQPTDPGHPTNKLITTGIFSISRNPLYLGGVCIIAGIALALNIFWILVLLPAALIASHYILIVPEERYLTTKFGEEYQAYAASVHRWIGHSRNKGTG